MQKFFAIAMFAIAALANSIAQAADMPQPYRPPAVADRVTPVRQCPDGLCNVYKSTRQHGLVQTQTDLVCIRVQQAHAGIIVIRFYDASGRELDVGNKQHSNVKQAIDTFCVGRHYLIKAQAGHVEVCNDVKTKTLRPQEIAILLTQGMPANAAVQLFAARKG